MSKAPQPVANKKRIRYPRLDMAEKLRVTIVDIKGGAHVIEVKASSLFEAVAQAVKLKKRSYRDVRIPADQGSRLRPEGRIRSEAEGFHGVARTQQPIPAGDINRMKIRELLSVKKMN
jgi:hypothetical protein